MSPGSGRYAEAYANASVFVEVVVERQKRDAAAAESDEPMKKSLRVRSSSTYLYLDSIGILDESGLRIYDVDPVSLKEPMHEELRLSCSVLAHKSKSG